MQKIQVFGENLSRIAFGGVIVMNETQQDANNYVAEAIDMGINYFDVAPTYGDAELRLGPALKGKRQNVFLACKTEDRSQDGARQLLEQSLKQLQTDYFDLYQLHAVYDLEDVEKIFGPKGAMETCLKAKDQGLIKRIGFSAHSSEAALALMERFDFESIMFPFNFASMLKLGYGLDVMEKAKSKSMVRLGIKSMALTDHKESDDQDHPKAWYHPIEDYNLAKKAVNYSVSQGVNIIIPPGDIDSLKWAVKIENEGYQLSEDDLAYLQEIADGTKSLFPLKSR